MDIYKNLLDFIDEYTSTNDKCIVKKQFHIKNVKLINLKEAFIAEGMLLEETDNEVLAVVKSGFLNLNSCFLCASVIDSVYIVAVAKEGIINQKTCDKAINKIIDRIEK